MEGIEKYALIAAAAALFFWPQIQAFLKQQKEPAKSSPSPTAPKSRTVGSDRGEWLQDLLGMQRVLESNGQKEAADLISQAMVKIVGMKDGGQE